MTKSFCWVTLWPKCHTQQNKSIEQKSHKSVWHCFALPSSWPETETDGSKCQPPSLYSYKITSVETHHQNLQGFSLFHCLPSPLRFHSHKVTGGPTQRDHYGSSHNSRPHSRYHTHPHKACLGGQQNRKHINNKTENNGKAFKGSAARLPSRPNRQTLTAGRHTGKR